MEEIISLIIPLLAVAGWLFGTFNKSEDGDRKRGKPVLQRNPTPTVSGEINTGANTPEKTPKTSSEQYAKAYSEQKQEQERKIKNQTHVESTRRSKEGSINPYLKPDQSSTNVPSASSLKSSMRGNLTKKGMVNSIVMAEVLGAPRALKPYSTNNRNIKR